MTIARLSLIVCVASDCAARLQREAASDAARREAAAAAGLDGKLTAAEERELAERATARDLKRMQIKNRALSVVPLIGSLYNASMLSVPIMHFCIGHLMAQGRLDAVDAEDVEALCKLLTVGGYRLEADTAASKSPFFGNVLAALVALTESPRLDKRIQLAVQVRYSVAAEAMSGDLPPYLWRLRLATYIHLAAHLQNVLDLCKAGWKLTDATAGAGIEREAKTPAA